MKKIYKRLTLIAVFLTIFCPSIYDVNNKIVYAAPTSISETMSKEEIMEKYYELKKDNQELIEKYNKLSEEWSSKKDNIDNRIKVIENCAKVISIIIMVVLGGSVVGIFKYIKDKVPKEVNKKVSEKTDAEFKYIESIIEDCKKEKELRDYKKIVVISKNNEEENILKDSDLLKQFQHVYYNEYNKLENETNNLKKYDVILFNDINGYFEDFEMNRIIKTNTNKNAVYFYFNKHNVKNPNQNKTFKCEGNENTNFAKSNSTFVGNLIDLMKYQDDILKNK